MKHFRIIAFFAFCIAFIFIQVTALNGEEKTDYTLTREKTPRKTVGEMDAIKIFVPKDGLYRVTYQELKGLGLAPEEIDFSNTALFEGGREYPFLIKGYEDSSFDRGDYLVFYGRQPHGNNTYRYKYSDDNVYRLELNRKGRLNEKEVYHAGDARLPKAGEVLRTSIHFEEDQFLDRFAHPQGGETDYSFLIPIMWSMNKNHRYIPFDLPGFNDGADTQKVTVRIYTYGRSNEFVSGADNHNIEYSIGEYYIGEDRWSGYVENLFENKNVPVDVFSETGNVINFDLIKVAGLEIDFIVLDWFEIEYPVRSEAINDALSFKIVKGHYKQTREINIGKFTSERIYLYNVTGDKFVEPAIKSDPALKNVAAFVANQSDVMEYCIAAEPALKTPSRITLSKYMGLKTAENSAEYIIITHEDFLSASERLNNFRRKLGFKTKLIPVDNIYDEFNHSLIHPTAIRDAIAYFYHNWKSPQLRYVLLVGDWSWDWYNVEGKQKQNFIPTWYVPHSKIEYATDSYLASVDDGDFIPEVALGRLPLKTTSEADTVVNKIINYELNFTDSAWRHKILLTASASQHFHDYCDSLVVDFIKSDYIVSKGYCDASSPLDVTQLIVDSCNDGLGLLLYAGHGSRYYWLTGTSLGHSSQDLEYNFQPEKIDLISNPYKTPIVFAATCFSNNFDNPADRNCIGEKFLIKQDGGALGVIASSSYSYIDNDKMFMKEMFVSAFNDKKPYLGDIFLHASRNCPSEEAVKMFLLLGDPLSRHGLIPLPGGAAQVSGKKDNTEYKFY